MSPSYELCAGITCKVRPSESSALTRHQISKYQVLGQSKVILNFILTSARELEMYASIRSFVRSG